MPDAVPRRERLNLWATCAVQFLGLAGMTAVLPLVPLYLQEIGVTDRAALKYWTGAIGAAPFAVAVFATPLWGALADRTGHKPMLVRSLVGLSLSTAGMGLSGTPLGLFLWRAVQGAVSGIFPAAVALISALTPEARVSRALALLQSARAAGALCGPLLGGLLADLAGVRGLFFGVAGVAALGAVLCSLVLYEPPRAARAAAAPVGDGGWRPLLASPPLLAMFALLALYQITIMASWPTLALFVEHLGVAREAVATTTGLLVFASGLPATLTATLWARLGRRTGPLPLLGVSLLLTGLANVALGVAARGPSATGLAGVLALRAGAGFAMAGFVPLAFEWMHGRAAAGARGRMAGLGTTAMMIGNVAGPLLGGWLAVQLGIAATFWAPGAALALAGAAVLAARAWQLERARRVA